MLSIISSELGVALRIQYKKKESKFPRKISGSKKLLERFTFHVIDQTRPHLLKQVFTDQNERGINPESCGTVKHRLPSLRKNGSEGV